MEGVVQIFLLLFPVCEKGNLGLIKKLPIHQGCALAQSPENKSIRLFNESSGSLI